jgi:hypothetical protein
MIFQKDKTKKTGTASTPAKASTAPMIPSRDRLLFVAGELAKAQAVVADLEARVARLDTIIADADLASAELQQAIAADGGESLGLYASGQAGGDSEISKMILAEETASRAAVAAKSALPKATSDLEAARAEVVRLGEAKSVEIGEYLMMKADGLARKYHQAFAELCRLHDEITGFALGIDSAVGEVAMVIEPVKVPRFNLPSLKTSAEYDPFLRHTPSSHIVESAAATWRAGRARLELNVNDDLDDLIGGAS